MNQEIPKAPRRSRSFLFWLTVALFLWFSLIGWLRLQQSIVQWHWLQSIGISPGPIYIAISGGLWGIAGLVSAIALWLRLAWGRLTAQISAIFLATSYWADRLVLSRSGDNQSNVVFALIVSFVALGFVLAELSRQETRPL